MVAASFLTNLTAIGLAIIIVAILVLDVHRDIRRLVSGRNVVLLSIIAWFLVEAIQLPVEVQRYSQSSYNFGVFCVALAMLAFLIGYYGISQGCRLFDGPASHIRVLENPDLLWRVVLIGALLGFAPIAYYSGLRLTQLLHDILGMRKTWGGLIGRGQYGDARSAALMLEMFVRGVGPFAVLLMLNRKVPLSRRWACAVIALWPILRAFGSGTRTAMITTTLPIFAVLYWVAMPRLQRRMVWIGLASTPLVYLFMAAMVGSRSSGVFSWQGAENTDYVGHEMFRELLYITQRVPKEVDYQLGYFYYVELVNPIPRFLWEGKPKVSSPVFISRLYGRVFPGTDTVYVTTHPGIIGEMYLNLGIAGVVVLSCVGGWLVRGWDRLVAFYRNSTVTMIFYSAGLATLIVLGRSFSANLFYMLAAFAMLAYVVDRYTARRPAMRMANNRSSSQPKLPARLAR